MLTTPVAIVFSGLIVTAGIVVLHIVARRRAVVEHPIVDRITVMLGEHEVHFDERMDRMQQEIMKDLDSLHERLEYLEQRDRERR